MHRVVKSHLESFTDSFGLADLKESERFEAFVNYIILTSKTNLEFDLDEVTTSEGDDGIDGVAILIDETVVSSKEDANDVFRSDRRNHDVELVFIQAKTGESFDLGDFLKFAECL